MILKSGVYYKLKIDFANFGVDSYIDENYAIVAFTDCTAFLHEGVTILQDLNDRTVKYMGPPSLAIRSSNEALILVETKFGDVRMIVDTNDLVPITISTSTPTNSQICVCATAVLMAAGCQCGSFKKEQAAAAEMVIKR